MTSSSFRGRGAAGYPRVPDHFEALYEPRAGARRSSLGAHRSIVAGRSLQQPGGVASLRAGAGSGGDFFSRDTTAGGGGIIDEDVGDYRRATDPRAAQQRASTTVSSSYHATSNSYAVTK